MNLAQVFELIALFKELLGPRTAKSVTIVTTMWDELWTEAQRERAENRYKQLENEHWKVTNHTLNPVLTRLLKASSRRI